VKVYAIALHLEQKEAGPYSRVTHSMLRAFTVIATDDKEAGNKAHEWRAERYPHWYFAGLAVEEAVDMYGVSTEGASWAMEGAK
jgi:hypothetical protein